VLVSSLDGPPELHAVTDLLVVDDWEHESTHCGRYAQRLVAAGVLPADGSQAVELDAVVTAAHPGRTGGRERIVVSPVGLAMDDVAAAWHVLRGARELGLGTPLRLRSGPPIWQ
jgi:ornithine cyclodeaminase